MFEIRARHAWLLQTRMGCYACRAMSDVVGFFVRDATARSLADDTRLVVDGFLSYVTRLDDAAVLLVATVRCSLRPDHAAAGGERYWMNHCSLCDRRIGDRYVFATTGVWNREPVHRLRLPHALRALGAVVRATQRDGAVVFDGAPAEDEARRVG